MRVDVIKIVILAFLIIISIGVLSYIKSQKKKVQKVIFEGFDVNAPMPRDFDNQTLEDSQLYGSIPQGATISIFHKAELKGLTANPDSIPIANGDKQGRGGGPQLEVTSIPPQPIPPDDIEAKLNAAADEEPVPFELDTTINEGFVTAAEANDAAIKAKALADEARALGQDPKAYAQAKAEAAIKAQALKMGYTGPMSKDELEAIATAKATQVANAALAKAGVKLPPLPKYDTSTTKGMIMQKAQDFLIAQAKSRLKDAVMNQLKSTKVAKLAGKLVAQAKALVLKGVKKVTEKIAGVFAKKLGAKIGAKATEGIFKKLAAKLVEKVTAAVAKAQSTAAGLASNPFTVAIGIMLSVISAVAMVVGISLPIILKGDEGVCEPGWRKVSEVWPSFLDNIPGVGDIMGVIAPYLCYLDACDPNEQEDAGLCYDKCDKGYNGIGPVCWANKTDSNAKAPAKTPCPSNMRDDGTSCWLDTRPNGVGTIPRTTGGGCHGGDCHGAGCPWSCHLECSPVQCDPLQSTCDGKVNVAGLCYNACPSGYHFVGGNLCEPDAGPGIKKTMMDRQYCPDADRELAHVATTIDQQCYTKCPKDTPYRVPGMPYICSAAKEVGDGRGKTSYGRGVGRPKLKLKMVTKTPPPPPPPGPTNSAAYADDPDTPCHVEFSDVNVLQDMCDFYYHAAVTNANVNADGSVSFGYITKITKVMGSSEQSADITCDITNIVVNTDTGKTLSTTVAVGSERRIYFAKIEKVCSFVVVGATNANGTAPDAKDPNAKVVNFTPVIQKCVDVPIGLKKCQGQDSINAMIAMYKKTLPPTVRIKSVDAVQDSGTDVCAVAWKEVTYDPATNLESVPVVKVGNFKYTQDKSNDACAYKLQSYSAGDPSASVTSLAKPVTYDTPLPPEVTLQGCSTTCKDPLMVQKLVAAFNNQPGSNRILSVGKVVTPSPLRCDIEADVYIGQTKATEKQKIRFDLNKDQASCVFSVATVGAGGTGSFIQSNTAALGTAISTKDTIMASSSDTMKSAQSNLSAAAKKITSAQGLANDTYEKVFSQFGQVEMLGSCSKKCSDPDVLNAIITYYNNVNYPTSRTGVTKKTMGRVLKAGTAGPNLCDILFEEKQETYGDLYTDTPTVNVTQKTQRFTMNDLGGCQFTVGSVDGFTGLPMSRKEGFQVAKTPSVINSVTPSLTPPYTGNGCQLDCTNADILNAMKQKYQSVNIEGFSRRPASSKKGFFGGIMALFTEAFQDVSDGSTTADPVADPVADPAVDTPTDTGTTDWNATAPTTDDATAPTTDDTTTPTATVDKVTTTVTPVRTSNMKKVNKALKLGIDKCEFEVVYDSSDTDATGNTTSLTDQVGYFTAIFTKDPIGCSFSPSQVTKSTNPVIPTVPSTKMSSIAFSF